MAHGRLLHLFSNVHAWQGRGFFLVQNNIWDLEMFVVVIRNAVLFLGAADHIAS